MRPMSLFHFSKRTFSYMGMAELGQKFFVSTLKVESMHQTRKLKQLSMQRWVR